MIPSTLFFNKCFSFLKQLNKSGDSLPRSVKITTIPRLSFSGTKRLTLHITKS